jgi:glutamate racemase
VSPDRRPVAVFDSGIGGLSVLRALHAALPHEDFVYFADTAHAPYGERDDAFVIERSLAIARTLLVAHAAKALVVACNTATAAAIDALRATYPSTPIVGIEPALKPAAALTRTGHVAVLATQGTLQSTRFAALCEAHGAQAEFHCVAGTGLVEAIERAATDPESDTTKLIAICDHLTLTFGVFGPQKGGMDVLVLGCTHYPFAMPHFQRLVGPDVAILEPGAAVARRAAELLALHGLRGRNSGNGSTTYRCSGDAIALENTAKRWLES